MRAQPLEHGDADLSARHLTPVEAHLVLDGERELIDAGIVDGATLRRGGDTLGDLRAVERTSRSRRT